MTFTKCCYRWCNDLGESRPYHEYKYCELHWKAIKREEIAAAIRIYFKAIPVEVDA